MKEKRVVKRMLIKGFFMVLFFSFLALLWRNEKIFMGVLVGSVLAYTNFLLLCLLAKDIIYSGSRFYFYMVQGVKYLLLSAILAFLFLRNIVDPVSCIIGFSVLWLIPFTEMGVLKNV